MKTIEQCEIADRHSLYMFIKMNCDDPFQCRATITEELYRGFDPLEYVEFFSVSFDDYCSGHGSRDYVPFVKGPSAFECNCDGKTWYEVRTECRIGRHTLIRMLSMLKTLKRMKSREDD